MGLFRRKGIPGEEMARGAVARSGGRHLATIFSATALALSLYSLWESSLRPADIHLYVPPVIQYAAPYQNSNFEMIAIPVTVANEGAQTGTLLSMELAVTDPRTNASKLFYSADFGRWTMERTRSGAYQPFAPISLAGHSSRTESVLFYSRGEEQRPEQLIREPGTYSFALRFEEAVSDKGLLDRIWPGRVPTVAAGCRGRPLHSQPGRLIFDVTGEASGRYPPILAALAGEGPLAMPARHRTTKNR